MARNREKEDFEVEQVEEVEGQNVEPTQEVVEVKKQVEEKNSKEVFLIRYSGKNIFTIEGKNFFPGNNEITREEWDRISKYSLIKPLFEEYVFEWLSESPDEISNGEERYPLGRRTVGESMQIIKDTIKESTLKNWLNKEPRSAVKEAIQNQISKLKLSPEEIQRLKELNKKG